MKTSFILLIFLFGTLAKADSTVLIGMASNFSELSTVSFNPYGGYFRNGVMMALDENRERLKRKKINIQLKEFDYGAEDLNVIKIIEEADRAGVSSVIGYNYSSNALIAAPLHVKKKIPMLSPSASANRLGTFGKYIHLGSFSNEYMARVLAKFSVNNLKAKKILIIPAVNCAYCVDLANVFTEEIKSSGGSVVASLAILQEDKQFDDLGAKVKGLDFDAVFIPNQELTAARIILSLLEAGIRKPFLGADGWGNEGLEFFSVLKGRQFEGYSVTHWHPSLKTKRSQIFVRNYQERFKKLPNDSSVLAYDYMNFLIKAILESNRYDRESLEKALSGMKHFEGVTGKYLLSANEAPSKDILILKTGKDGFIIGRVLPAVRIK